MTTLADMTEEERTNCIGMWCYIFERLNEPPIYEGIIAGYRESDNGRILVVVDHPHPDAGKWGYGLNEVAPRFDLPRAWDADGQPPAGSWEYFEPFGKGEFTTRCGSNTTHRRWVNSWEKV